MMHRRDFLRTLAAAGVVGALPHQLLGCTPAEADQLLTFASTTPSLPPKFPNSLLTATRNEVDLDLNLISGTWPADIGGHVFIVAALPWGDGTMVFNGDGMMYRLDLEDGRPKLKSRVAKSPCYWADQATQGNEDIGFRNFGITRLSGALGIRNELNTGWLAFGDRLLVTYDGGRPWEVDVETLELVAPMGKLAEWRNSIPFVAGPLGAQLSTAHPYFDEHTGEVFSVNYGGDYSGQVEPFVDVVRWDGEGAVRRWTLVEDGKPVHIKQSIHQMAITQDYIVMVDCAFLVEDEQILDQSIARAHAPHTVMYIARRDDMTDGATQIPVVRAVLDRETVHLTADYENPGGKIVIHAAHNTATDASEWVRPDDVLYHSGAPVRPEFVGLIPTATDINHLGRHVVDAVSGEVSDARHHAQDEYTWGVAFFTHHGQTAPGAFEHIFFNSMGFTDETLTTRVAELYKDYPHRKVALADLVGTRPGAVFHFDPNAMEIVDGYIFPQGRIGGSPQFVPRRGAKHGADGYVVCSVVSDDASRANSSGDELWIFDAQQMARGPLARIGHPEVDLGFTLHTTYLPELKTRTSSYKVDIRADYEPKLENSSQEIKDLFAQHVFPKFES
jgi:carotenoid cleavage dioxygenase-like enzyme